MDIEELKRLGIEDERVVAIHQPNYIPYGGYFDKISKADAFVFFDNAQFTKRSYIHRNKITVDKWLTIPIKKQYIGKKINEVYIFDNKFRMSHFNQLINNFCDASYYSKHIDNFDKIYRDRKLDNLVSFNVKLIKYICKSLHIGKEFYFASELEVDNNFDIVHKLGGTVYLSGISGRKYINEKPFKKNKIKVIYNQYNGSKLSVLDDLFRYDELKRSDKNE